MKQRISKVRKYIGILIGMVGVAFISSVLLIDIVDSLLLSFVQYSLLDDESSLVFIVWITCVMIILEIIGLIVYKRNKSISNE